MRALLAYSFSCAFPASLIYGRVVPPSVRPLGCLPYLASHFVLLCVCLLTPSMSVRVLLLFDRLLGRSSVGGVTRALVCAVETDMPCSAFSPATPDKGLHNRVRRRGDAFL